MLKSAKWLLVAGLVGGAGVAMAHGHDSMHKDMQSQDVGKGGAGMSGQGNMQGTSAQSMGMSKLDEKQIGVLDQIHQDNLAEIQVAQLAQQNGMSNDVKKFAERLVKDHQDADKKVMKLAEKHDVTLSAADQQPDIQRMIEEHKASLEKLRGLQGMEFDREFLTTQVQDHDKAIALVSEAESTYKKDPVGKLAGDLLPHLRHHRDEASRLLKNLQRTPSSARRPAGGGR